MSTINPGNTATIRIPAGATALLRGTGRVTPVPPTIVGFSVATMTGSPASFGPYPADAKIYVEADSAVRWRLVVPVPGGVPLPSDDPIVGLLGDSRPDQHHNASRQLASLPGFAHAAQKFAAAAGTRFIVPGYANLGVSGEMTNQYIARVPRMMDIAPRACIIFGFLNNLDLVKNPSVVDTASAYQAAADAVNDIVGACYQLLSVGTIPIVCTDYPVLSWVTQYQRNGIAYGNALIRELIPTIPGACVFDLASYVMDATDTTYKPLASALHSDNTHLNYKSAWYIGRGLAKLLAPMFPASAPALAISGGNTFANNSRQVGLNPLFLTKNTGTYAAGITTFANGDGVTGPGASGSATSGVPAGVDISRSATGAATVTQITGVTSRAKTGGNTGNGVMGAITATTAKAGDYTLTIIAAAVNAGTFLVAAPDGTIVGAGTVGAAFSAGGLAFTLADGATDFVVGDQFVLTVPPATAGNRLVLTCSLPASGDEVRFTQTLTGGSWTPVPGKRYVAVGRISVRDPVNIQTVKTYFQAVLSVSGTQQWMDGNPLTGAASTGIPESFSYPVEVPLMALPPGETITSIVWTVRITSSAASGSGVLELSEFDVLEV